MNQSKIKKYSLRFGIVFLVVLAILTYFSSTIDNALLPRVKVTDIESGQISEDITSNFRYLVPLSAVVYTGDNQGYIYILSKDSGNTVVEEIDIQITGSNDLYYEIETVLQSDRIYGESVVYYTTKSISDGDRVYVES